MHKMQCVLLINVPIIIFIIFAFPHPHGSIGSRLTFNLRMNTENSQYCESAKVQGNVNDFLKNDNDSSNLFHKWISL